MPLRQPERGSNPVPGQPARLILGARFHLLIRRAMIVLSGRKRTTDGDDVKFSLFLQSTPPSLPVDHCLRRTQAIRHKLCSSPRIWFHSNYFFFSSFPIAAIPHFLGRGPGRSEAHFGQPRTCSRPEGDPLLPRGRCSPDAFALPQRVQLLDRRRQLDAVSRQACCQRSDTFGTFFHV